MAKNMLTRRCTIHGCKRAHRARGYCAFHYNRWHRGQPLVLRPDMPDLQLPESEAEIGYIAGLIDGEGSVFLANGRAWRVRIGMTDREVIDWLSQIGGAMQIKPRGGRRRTMYAWEVARRADVLALLQRVFPHMKLITKKEKARRAIRDTKSSIGGEKTPTSAVLCLPPSEP